MYRHFIVKLFSSLRDKTYVHFPKTIAIILTHFVGCTAPMVASVLVRTEGLIERHPAFRVNRKSTHNTTQRYDCEKSKRNITTGWYIEAGTCCYIVLVKGQKNQLYAF